MFSHRNLDADIAAVKAKTDNLPTREPSGWLWKVACLVAGVWFVVGFLNLLGALSYEPGLDPVSGYPTLRPPLVYGIVTMGQAVGLGAFVVAWRRLGGVALGAWRWVFSGGWAFVAAWFFVGAVGGLVAPVEFPYAVFQVVLAVGGAALLLRVGPS